MNDDYTERRQHVRIYFWPEEEVRGILVREGGEEKIEVPVLNLSEGGICFVLNKNSEVVAGNRFTLSCLQDKVGVLLKSEVSMQITWTLQHDVLEAQTVGCEFLGMSEGAKSCLSSIITQKIAASRNG
jgi:c-di-GMP-binding flagellar brake protein YcgR